MTDHPSLLLGYILLTKLNGIGEQNSVETQMNMVYRQIKKNYS
jgi:hypothetical protein